MNPSDAYYVRMAEAIERGPQTYGGDAAVASLRCFRAYHKDARFHVQDVDGRQRWLTPTMMRVQAIALRVGTVGSGYITTRDFAAEARCSAGYVSKLLTRLEAWGLIGTVRTRGRGGKLFIFAREKFDQLDHYAAEARRRIREAAIRRFARNLRSGGIVSSMFARGRKALKPADRPSVDMVETISALDQMTPWARAVAHERARLAIEDPAGEADAVRPLSPDQATLIYAGTFPIDRQGYRRDYSRENDQLAAALGLNRERGTVRCPAHEDRRASLSYAFKDGRYLLHCFAGCTFAEIRKAVLG